MVRPHWVLAKIALITLAVSGPAVHAQDTRQTVTPTTQWNADFGEHSCALRRGFGDDDLNLYFEMRQYSPGDHFLLMVAADGLELSEDAIELSFVPDTEPKRPPFDYVRLQNGMTGVSMRTSLRPAAGEQAVTTVAATEGDASEPTDNEVTNSDKFWSEEERDQREREISMLQLDGAFTEDLTLMTGPMHDAMTVMRQCMDDLMMSRGIDPVTMRGDLARPPRPIEQVRWTRQIIQSYPSVALRSEMQGEVRVMAIIDENGRVEDCNPLAHDNIEVLAEAACDDVSRFARFEPAIDGEGNPTRGFFTTVIIYSIN